MIVGPKPMVRQTRATPCEESGPSGLAAFGDFFRKGAAIAQLRRIRIFAAARITPGKVNDRGSRGAFTPDHLTLLALLPQHTAPALAVAWTP